MRNWLAYLAVATLTLSSLISITSTEGAAKTIVGISIDKIIKNKYIQGRVFGMEASQYSKHKVLVYTYTDKWYIHPYAKGKNYASIARNGTWRILTKKREYGSYKVVALIVKKSYRPPASLKNIDTIKSVARIVKDTGYKDGDKDWKL